MVTRVWTILALSLVSVTAHAADDAPLRMWVERNDIQAEIPFSLFVEVSGKSITAPQFTKTDDFVIDITNPQMFRRTVSVRTSTGIEKHEIHKYSFFSRAVKDGTLTIPAVSARINGKTVKSESVVMTVTKANPADIPNPNSIRLWVNRKTVTTGDWFWIYIEATGFDIGMPRTLEVEGLVINTANVQQSVTSGFGRNGVTIYKRGYYARVDKAGTIEIPPIKMMVSGRPAQSNSLTLTVINNPVAVVAPNPGSSSSTSDQNFPKEDELVFTVMDVDKKEVYLGESILLTTQMWQIIYRRISTGPYRGALNIQPTTKGFYVKELEPDQFESTHGPWRYNVTERRKVLYPTRTSSGDGGDLEIGAWHWEGIALVNRQSITEKKRYYRKLDQGPFSIVVKNLPDSPKGFAGAVGQFQVHSKFENTSVIAGRPFELSIIVRGQGNSDAVGSPTIPNLDWAHVSEPKRSTRYYNDPGESLPSSSKTFTYTITPLNSGDVVISAFDYASFDPRAEKYDIATLGPFRFNVQADPTSAQHLLVPDEVAIMQRSVDILANDIHPMLDAPNGLARYTAHPIATMTTFAAPAIAYLALVVFMARRRRLTDDVGYARNRKAKHRGIRRLNDVFDADEPAEELFRTVAGYIGDKFNVHDAGMTSADVTEMLQSHDVGVELTETFGKILKSCERSQYASQALSIDELRALVQASETAIHAFDDWRKHGDTR